MSSWWAGDARAAGLCRTCGTWCASTTRPSPSRSILQTPFSRTTHPRQAAPPPHDVAAACPPTHAAHLVVYTSCSVISRIVAGLLAWSLSGPPDCRCTTSYPDCRTMCLLFRFARTPASAAAGPAPCGTLPYHPTPPVSCPNLSTLATRLPRPRTPTAQGPTAVLFAS